MKRVKKSARWLSLLLAAMLAASLTGCGERASSSTPSSSSTSSSSSASAEESSEPEKEKSLYPVVTDGSITLKYWCSIANAATQYIQTYSENIAYQDIMEKTGINIEFIHPVTGQEQEQFNIMMVSGELPDIIGNGNYYTGGVSQGVVDGFFANLFPYLEECAPDYYALINSSEEAYRQTHYSEDCVTAFCPLSFETAPAWLRPLVRQDLLDEFGIEALVTYDDYETYFQKILDEKEDIVPMVLRANNGNDMNTFMTGYDLAPGFFVKEGGKIRHWYSDENLLPFLTRMNEWYQKGYISKDSTSLDSKQIFAMYDAGQLGCYIDSVDALFSRNSKSEILTIGSAPYPRLTEGQQIHTGPSSNIVTGSPVAITAACENIEAAVKFLNYGYTEEGSRTYNYGVEGQTYTLVDGVPQFTDMMLHPDNGMTASNVSYIYKIHFGPKLCAPDTKAHPGVVGNTEALAFRMKWSDDANVDSAYRLPSFTLTEDENSERATVMTNVDTYAAEMILRFITGVEPLSSFDAFSAQVETLGLPRAIELTQQAYDRYMAK